LRGVRLRQAAEQDESARSGLMSRGTIVGFEAHSPKPPAAASETRSFHG
jgi:hypothetical protein